MAGIGSQIAYSVVSAVTVMLVPVITVPLFIMGALAGFTNIYKMAKKIYGLGKTDRKGQDVKKIK